jgi:type VI protein secretion system component VasK
MLTNLWHWLGWDGVIATFFWAVVLIVVGPFVPLAQIEGLPDWGPVAQMGAVGVLAWFCWHMTKYTIPRIVKEHREETKQLVADFRSDLREERSARNEMLKTFRCRAERE